jgi:hypothetical protein
MPHVGHGPGFGSRTSAHIGQTYAVEFCGSSERADVGFGAVSVTKAGGFGFRYFSGSA